MQTGRTKATDTTCSWGHGAHKAERNRQHSTCRSAYKPDRKAESMCMVGLGTAGARRGRRVHESAIPSPSKKNDHEAAVFLKWVGVNQHRASHAGDSSPRTPTPASQTLARSQPFARDARAPPHVWSSAGGMAAALPASAHSARHVAISRGEPKTQPPTWLYSPTADTLPTPHSAGARCRTPLPCPAAAKYITVPTWFTYLQHVEHDDEPRPPPLL